jgi:hypothetical protein|tara:strand:+ start:104 stop:418 length:315 start_codon:yes stop_codon:yes gene_type:complete
MFLVLVIPLFLRCALPACPIRRRLARRPYRLGKVNKRQEEFPVGPKQEHKYFMIINFIKAYCIYRNHSHIGITGIRAWLLRTIRILELLGKKSSDWDANERISP